METLYDMLSFCIWNTIPFRQVPFKISLCPGHKAGEQAADLSQLTHGGLKTGCILVHNKVNKYIGIYLKTVQQNNSRVYTLQFIHKTTCIYIAIQYLYIK